jgi:predicted enzyme related to lactoylglutathione lyase
MHISTVTLLVKDVDRAIDFYTKKLGWEKTMDAPMGDERWVTVAPANAQTAFYLAQRWPDRPEVKAGGATGVILEVDDVYQTQKDFAKKQIEFTEAPRTEPWGGFAMFKDSEGNILGLHSPAEVSAGHR